MARPDKVFVEFRGIMATDVGGAFGDGDLVLVANDGSGYLVAAETGTAEGVIWTPEGKANSDVANYLTATAGSVVTVFQIAQFTDTLEFADGDVLWSTAGGDVVTALDTSGTVQKIGTVYVGHNGESRLNVNISLAD